MLEALKYLSRTGCSPSYALAGNISINIKVKNDKIVPAP
jgi:hypothetical protein